MIAINIKLSIHIPPTAIYVIVIIVIHYLA